MSLLPRVIVCSVLMRIAAALLLFSTGILAQTAQFTILPFAGTPLNIGDNGPATAALLNSPHGVSVDSAGNIYIADTSYNLLRRVSVSGIITTATNQLLFPWHAAIAPNGDVYVADAGDNRILKIAASSAAVSTFAPSLSLASPRDVAIDSFGNVFILDSGNNRVLKATPDGSVVSYAGTGAQGYFGDGGPAIQAQLDFPYGIALDAAGNLFISDSNNQRIRVVTVADHNINTIAGINKSGYNGDNAPLGTAFNYPAGLAVDPSGTLYVADTWNHVIRKITQPLTPNAVLTTIAGTGTPGFSGEGSLARSAQLNFPFGVAVDAQGNILIADSANNRIREISAQGIIMTVAGSDHGAGDGGPALSARMFGPSGVAIAPDGSVYIAEANNNRVRQVSTDGIISTVASGLNSPNGLAFDATGALYIADTDASVIRKLVNGSMTIVAGILGVSGNDGDNEAATSAHLESPNAVVFDRAGNMYIADSGNNRVRIVDPGGTIHPFAGDARQGLPGYDGDGGPASSAHLNYPRALAIDTHGNVYIADFFNDRVRMVSALNQTITTLAGNGVRGGAGDGSPATQAQLALPTGLAFDNLGNLYIADSLNNRIRMIAANGTLQTVAGGTAPGDAGDGGPALGALINSPRDLAIDSRGIIYFSDQDNDRVRQLLAGVVAISEVVNAASFMGGGVAPGETVTIYGTDLAPDGVASSVPASVVTLSTNAANTQVLFDGVPAPLTYLSGSQINAVVPYEVAGNSSTNIVVQTQGRNSLPLNVPVVPAAPGIFPPVLNQDGSQNSPSNPAHIGDTIVFFATGEGQTNPPGVTGQLATGPVLPAPVLPVVVQIGGQTATLAYAGELPQGAGVLQVNAVIPAGVAPGPSVPLTLSIGGAQAQSGVTVSIAGPPF